VIGRILSLGFPLPGVRVDNYNFCSAPSFFDYDAIVVDPAALSHLIQGVLDGSVDSKTFSDRRVVNMPEHANDAALADVLLRRRDETRALLDHGGVIVCFAHPPTVHRGIAGIDALDDYYWLGDHAPDLVAGDGTQGEICDYQHPMAPFVHGQLANLSYRAHLRGASNPFVRSYGGAAIGGDIASERGRIVMLPALKSRPSGDGRYALSEALQAGIRRMLGVIAEGRSPFWTARYGLSGLDELTQAVDAANKALGVAQAALADAQRAHDEVAGYQRLLWQQGQVGLEDAVVDALRLIGFDVYANDPNALELRTEGACVLFEIEASDGAVDMAPHYRLRQRIERAIERTGDAARGLIIVNGHRLLAPDERPPQASEALRTAAATMRYTIATTASLFDAVSAKLSGDDETVAAFRRQLTAGEGPL
jgi:hypothetical protein